MTNAPATDPPGPHLRYIEGLREGRLDFQRCLSCATAVFHPRVLCPACGSCDFRWETSDGNGEVYSASRLAPRNGEPYVVVLVDLDEGFRLMSTVRCAPAVIGQRVTAQIEQSENPTAEPLLVFVPAVP